MLTSTRLNFIELRVLALFKVQSILRISYTAVIKLGTVPRIRQGSSWVYHTVTGYVIYTKKYGALYGLFSKYYHRKMICVIFIKEQRCIYQMFLLWSSSSVTFWYLFSVTEALWSHDPRGNLQQAFHYTIPRWTYKQSPKLSQFLAEKPCIYFQ